MKNSDRVTRVLLATIAVALWMLVLGQALQTADAAQECVTSGEVQQIIQAETSGHATSQVVAAVESAVYGLALTCDGFASDGYISLSCS